MESIKAALLGFDFQPNHHAGYLHCPSSAYQLLTTGSFGKGGV